MKALISSLKKKESGLPQVDWARSNSEKEQTGEGEFGTWHYIVVDPSGVRVRSQPAYDKKFKLNKKIEEGEVVKVCERLGPLPPQGVTFLKLATGDGWAFDVQPEGDTRVRMAEIFPEKKEQVYRVIAPKGIGIRSRPSLLQKAVACRGPECGDLVKTSERIAVGDMAFLRLADGRGWIFDKKNGKTMVAGPIQDSPGNSPSGASGEAPKDSDFKTVGPGQGTFDSNSYGQGGCDEDSEVVNSNPSPASSKVPSLSPTSVPSLAPTSPAQADASCPKEEFSFGPPVRSSQSDGTSAPTGALPSGPSASERTAEFDERTEDSNVANVSQSDRDLGIDLTLDLEAEKPAEILDEHGPSLVSEGVTAGAPSSSDRTTAEHNTGKGAAERSSLLEIITSTMEEDEDGGKDFDDAPLPELAPPSPESLPASRKTPPAKTSELEHEKIKDDGASKAESTSPEGLGPGISSDPASKTTEHHSPGKESTSAEKQVTPAAPNPWWRSMKAKDGREYWQHMQTGQISWEQPTIDSKGSPKGSQEGKLRKKSSKSKESEVQSPSSTKDGPEEKKPETVAPNETLESEAAAKDSGAVGKDKEVKSRKRDAGSEKSEKKADRQAGTTMSDPRWEQLTAKDGRTYHRHIITGQIRWD